MDVTVRVDVATARPPREHDFMTVTVAVELPDLGDITREIDFGTIQAREIAAQMAACHPHVVMPVRTTVLAIDNI